MPFERAQWREVSTLSGGEQKRLVLEALLRGPDEVLLLDEPDNYLDVPTKRWLEDAARRVAQDGAVRQPRPRAARPGGHPHRHARAEPRRQHRVGAPGAVLDVRRRPGPTATPASRSCAAAGTRSTRSSRRWSSCTGRRRRTTTGWPRAYRPPRPGCASSRRPGRPRRCRCARRCACGSPAAAPPSGRSSRPGSSCSRRPLMKPFDLEVWFGERVGVLGSNGSGKSHFLRLLAAGGSDPDREHQPVGDIRPDPGRARRPASCSGRGCGPGWFAQTHDHAGAARAHPARDPAPRRRPPRRDAARARRPRARPLRPGARPRSRPSTRCPAGSRRGCRSCCSSCRGATLLLLDEPTDNLDLHSAEALEDALDALRGHRARRDPRPVVRPRASTGSSSSAPTAGSCESDEPVWDEGRVSRPR